MANSKPKIDPSEVATLAETDLRRFRRHLCMEGSTLRLAIRPEFRGRRALLVDISSGGLGFIMENPLEEGTMLVFELKAGAGPDAEAKNRVARVRHCRPHPVPADAPWALQPSGFKKVIRTLFSFKAATPAHAWFIGCEFDQPLTEVETIHFIQRLKLLAADLIA